MLASCGGASRAAIARCRATSTCSSLRGQVNWCIGSTQSGWPKASRRRRVESLRRSEARCSIRAPRVCGRCLRVGSNTPELAAVCKADVRSESYTHRNCIHHTHSRTRWLAPPDRHVLFHPRHPSRPHCYCPAVCWLCRLLVRIQLIHSCSCSTFLADTVSSTDSLRASRAIPS